MDIVIHLLHERNMIGKWQERSRQQNKRTFVLVKLSFSIYSIIPEGS